MGAIDKGNKEQGQVNTFRLGAAGVAGIGSAGLGGSPPCQAPAEARLLSLQGSISSTQYTHRGTQGHLRHLFFSTTRNEIRNTVDRRFTILDEEGLRIDDTYCNPSSSRPHFLLRPWVSDGSQCSSGSALGASRGYRQFDVFMLQSNPINHLQIYPSRTQSPSNHQSPFLLLTI